MATTRELIQRLQEEQPLLWTWLQSNQSALDKVRRSAENYSHFPEFFQALQKLPLYQNYLGGQEVTPEDVVIPEEMFDVEDTPFGPPTFPVTDPNRDVRAALQQFLTDNELPQSLMSFIQTALSLDKPMSQIVAELRQTPEYRQAYPENDIRSAHQLPWMSENEIRAYRDEARRITREYMGVDVGNDEIAQLIGRGTSLRSWEHRLQVNDAVERWGGAVQGVFEGYTGAPLSNERLHMFFDPDYDTSQIDDMYEMALRRGQPTALGFATRPEDEARLLQQMGIGVEQVFKNYQTIRSEMPRFERLAAIGRYLDTQGQDFFGDVSISGSLLFRGVQLGDPEALKELQRRTSEEAVRWQAGGGPARTSGGSISGLSPR